MSRLCSGDFSNETTLRLRAAYLENPSGLFIEPCGRCGTRVVALNKSGVWVPKTHDAPSRRRAYKSGGYKRSSK